MNNYIKRTMDSTWCMLDGYLFDLYDVRLVTKPKVVHNFDYCAEGDGGMPKETLGGLRFSVDLANEYGSFSIGDIDADPEEVMEAYDFLVDALTS